MSNPVDEAVNRLTTDLSWLADQRYLANSSGSDRVPVSVATLTALDSSLRATLEVVVAIQQTLKTSEASSEDPLSQLVDRLKKNAAKAQAQLSAQAVAAANGQRTAEE